MIPERGAFLFSAFHQLLLVAATIVLVFALPLALAQAEGEVRNPALQKLSDLLVAPQQSSSSEDSDIKAAFTVSLSHGKRRGELFDLLTSKPNRALAPFEPHSWLAIDPLLCDLAGLPHTRCLSLTCFTPQLNPQEAQACPAPTQNDQTTDQIPLRPRGLEGFVPPPDNPQQIPIWLDQMGGEIEKWVPPTDYDAKKIELIRALGVGIKAKTLPVNMNIVTAKGVLHQLWPLLQRQAAQYPKLSQDQLDQLINSRALPEYETHLEKMAWIIAVARGLDEVTPQLSADLRAKIDAEASKLRAKAKRLEAVLEQIQNGEAAGLALFEEIETVTKTAETELADLRNLMAADFLAALPPSVAQLPDLLASCSANEKDLIAKLTSSEPGQAQTLLAEGLSATCRQSLCQLQQDQTHNETGAHFIMLDQTVAKTEGNNQNDLIRFALKPKAEANPQTQRVMELVAVSSFGLPNEATCFLPPLEIVPLGIEINSVSMVDGKLRLDVPEKTLIQLTRLDDFRKGFDRLLAIAFDKTSNKVLKKPTPEKATPEIPTPQLPDISQLPSTLRIEGAGLIIEDKDLRNVKLVTDYRVPGLNIPVKITTTLIEEGKPMLKLSSEALLEPDQMINQVNEHLAGAMAAGNLKLGPFDITSPKAQLAPGFKGNARASGVWLDLSGQLKLGEKPAGEITAQLVSQNGKARLVPKVDLAPLLNAFLNETLTQAASAADGLLGEVRTKLQSAFGPEQQAQAEAVVAKLKSAVLIESVKLGDDGKVMVTLLLDLNAVLGGDMFDGARPQPIMVTRELDPYKPDLGLGKIYEDLFKALLAGGDTWLQAAKKAFASEVQKAVDAEIDEAVNKLQDSAEKLGLDLKVEKAGFFLARKRNLILSLKGDPKITATISDIEIIVGQQPRIDFGKASVDGKTLARLVMAKLKPMLEDVADLGWELDQLCAEPVVNITKGQISLQLAVKLEAAGCVALPAIGFDGHRLSFDETAIKAYLESTLGPLLLQKAVSLIPDNVRDYLDGPVDQAIKFVDQTKFREISIAIKSDIDGLDVPLTGTVNINLKTLEVKLATKVDNAIFNAALGEISKLTGDSLKVAPLEGRFGLRASAKFDSLANIAGLSFEIPNMEVTPKRIYLPELKMILPIVIVIGPVTVFPVEISGRLDKPQQITLGFVGSFAATKDVLAMRASLCLPINSCNPDDPASKSLLLNGRLILLSAIDLFAVEAEIDPKAEEINAKAESLGVLKALMPVKQTMRLTKDLATTHAKGKVLGVDVETNITVNFKAKPNVKATGEADLLGGLSNLSADLETDFQLRNPRLKLQGSHNLGIGTVSYGVKADLHKAKLDARVLGLKASLILPGPRDINASLLEKLFKNLLKPSIDLEALKDLNLDIQLSTQISGDGEGGNGKKSGGDGTDENPKQPDGGNAPVEPPSDTLPEPEVQSQAVPKSQGDIFFGTIPSEWQSLYRESPTNSGLYCEAQVKAGGPVEFVSNTLTPKAVAELMNSNVFSFSLGRSDQPLQQWKDCEDRIADAAGTETTAYFDKTDQVKIWTNNRSTIETDTDWINSVLTKMEDGLRPSSVTATTGLTFETGEALRFIHDKRQQNVAVLEPVRVSITDTRFVWKIDARGQGTSDQILLIDPVAKSERRFSGADLEAKLIRKLDDNPIMQPLRPQVLTLLLADWRARVLYSGNEGVIIVSNEKAHPFVLGEQPRCAPFVEFSELYENFNVHEDCSNNDKSCLLRPIFQELTSPDPQQSCEQAAENWQRMTRISSTTSALERIILSHKTLNKDSWKIAFVDRQQIEGPCLRVGVDSESFGSLVQSWKDNALITAAAATELVKQQSGFELIYSTILKPDLDWSEASFPQNPLLLANCKQ